MAAGVEVLAHEAIHKGKHVESESLTACFTFQTVEQTTLALGASQEVASNITDFIIHHSVYRGNPTYQTSPNCRDGGSEDLNPSIPGGNFPPHQ